MTRSLSARSGRRFSKSAGSARRSKPGGKLPLRPSRFWSPGGSRPGGADGSQAALLALLGSLSGFVGLTLAAIRIFGGIFVGVDDPGPLKDFANDPFLQVAEYLPDAIILPCHIG